MAGDVKSDWKKNIVLPEASHHLCVKWEWLSIQKVQTRVGRIPQTLTRAVWNILRSQYFRLDKQKCSSLDSVLSQNNKNHDAKGPFHWPTFHLSDLYFESRKILLTQLSNGKVIKLYRSNDQSVELKDLQKILFIKTCECWTCPWDLAMIWPQKSLNYLETRRRQQEKAGNVK